MHDAAIPRGCLENGIQESKNRIHGHPEIAARAWLMGQRTEGKTTAPTANQQASHAATVLSCMPAIDESMQDCRNLRPIIGSPNATAAAFHGSDLIWFDLSC